MKSSDLISYAIIEVIKLDYLYGIVLSKFDYCEDNNIETIGVKIDKDRVSCNYNPKFISSLKVEALSQILMHEVLHILFRHPIRKRDYESSLWNIACDLAVNSLLPEMRNLFPDGLYPEKFGFDYGELAEQYYELLKEDSGYREKKSGDGSVEVFDGEKMVGKYYPMESIETESVEESTLKNLVKKSIEEVSNKLGGITTNFEVLRLIEKSLENGLNWKLILRRFLGCKERGETRTTYTRPNRRLGFSNKGKVRVRYPFVIFAVDTSGSMDDDMLFQIQHELEEIRKIRKAKIEVIECDVDVQQHYKFKEGKKVSLDFYGRGGTSFVPVFKYVKEKNIKPDALVYFTDMYGTFPKNKPPYPVLWISTSGNLDAPFGKVIEIKNEIE